MSVPNLTDTLNRIVEIEGWDIHRIAQEMRDTAEDALALVGVITQHAEAILARHAPVNDGSGEVCICGAWPPPCRIQQHALAILGATKGTPGA